MNPKPARSNTLITLDVEAHQAVVDLFDWLGCVSMVSLPRGPAALAQGILPHLYAAAAPADLLVVVVAALTRLRPWMRPITVAKDPSGRTTGLAAGLSAPEDVGAIVMINPERCLAVLQARMPAA